MSMHKGRPSGLNKPDAGGTGIPTNFKPAGLKKDRKLTRKYTDNDEKLAKHVRSKHPNRNVNKKEATNAGGYRN